MSKWLKFLDYGSGIHFLASFLAGMPLTAMGIVMLFVPFFEPVEMTSQRIMAILILICGSHCLVGFRYPDLSEWIRGQYMKEANK